MSPGRRLVCPLLLQAILDVLPADEPLPLPGVGGAPAVPFSPLRRVFLYAPFYELEDNSAALWRALADNPAYLQRCGLPGNELPSERTLQRFNHVMNTYGLWEEARRRLVEANLDDEVLPVPRRLAIDPTHQDGYAKVKSPCAACRACRGCPPEEQVRTCDVTEIVAKRSTYRFPGVKGVVVTDVDSEIPILMVSVPASTNDGRTGALAAKAAVDAHPRLATSVTEVSADGAYDVKAEKEAIGEVFGGADVLTPINPRGRKNRPVEGQRGVTHVDPYGVPHCVAGEAMTYRGKDEARKAFRFGCPAFNQETGEVNCPRQAQCCPNPGKQGRQVRVPASEAPQVD